MSEGKGKRICVSVSPTAWRIFKAVGPRTVSQVCDEAIVAHTNVKALTIRAEELELQLQHVRDLIAEDEHRQKAAERRERFLEEVSAIRPEVGKYSVQHHDEL